MKNKLFRLLPLTLCLSLLTGCSLLERSEFVMPETDIPEHWQQGEHSASTTESTAENKIRDKWWEQFNNPELNRLIEQALQSNNDLALVSLTLRQARLRARLSDNDKLPELSFKGAASNEKYFNSGDTDNSYSTTTSLSYELDLWGELVTTADATQWAAQVSEQDRESTAQSLVVTVATLYWKVGYLNQRINLANLNIEGLQQVIILTKNRYQNGSETRLAVLESTQSLYKQQVTYNELQQQLSEAKNALSILLNRPLEDVLFKINKLPKQTMPDISAGIPADLLVRRPDIKAKLYALKSTLASKDAVVGSYFPTLTLTGSLGTSSSQLIKLLHNPLATLGTELTLPFLNWNEMKLDKKVAQLDYQKAVIDYRVALYNAFEEVANYLSARKHYQYQGEKLHDQYVNAQQIEKIHESQYSVGAINMVDWINAMEERRDAQAALIENKYNQFITQAKLYQSLGGKDIAPAIESSY